MTSPSAEGGESGKFLPIKEEWRVMEEVNKVCEMLELMIKAAAYDSISDMSGVDDSNLARFVRWVVDHERKANKAIEEYACKMIEEFAKQGIVPVPKDFVSILGYPLTSHFRGSVILRYTVNELVEKVSEGIKPILEKLYNEGVIKSTEGEKKEMGQTQ